MKAIRQIIAAIAANTNPTSALFFAIDNNISGIIALTVQGVERKLVVVLNYGVYFNYGYRENARSKQLAKQSGSH